MDENTVNEDGDILGTQLLRIALDMSFNQTLAKHTAFARSEIDEICRAGDYGGCVITGSSLVKTLYGPESHKNWKSDNPKIAHDFDLDVFCTREKQRQVITKLRAMKLYGYTLYDSEVYALGEQNIQGYHIVTSTKSSYAFYHKKKKSTDESQQSSIGVLNRRPKELDLVVGKNGFTNGRDLLQYFDFTICRTSYDGKRFHIPEPHHSLRFETTVQPTRLEVMFASAQGLAKFFLPASDPLIFSPLDNQLITKKIILTTLENQPYEFIQRLFTRIFKYHSRGVKILGIRDSFILLGQKINAFNKTRD